MSLQILINEAKLPAANNDAWILPVLDGEVRRKWLVDGFDLALWFKEVMGRYPAHNKGDNDTWDDLKANWSQLEKRFYRELEKQIELGATITVDGARITALEWERVRMLPAEELPPLTESQREAARRSKISDEEYSRNFLASEFAKTALFAKTERLTRFLSDQLKRLAPGGEIERVVLSTVEAAFDIEVRDEGTSIPVRIREEIVDEFLEGGSAEAEARIIKVLETATRYRHRAVQ